MIYLLFKSINLDKRIGVSNLKDEIDKVTLAKLGENIKDLLDDMSSNYSINIDTGERHEDYVRHIFRDLLTGTDATFDYFIERTKEYWETVREVTEI